MNANSINAWLKKNKSNRIGQKFLAAAFSFFGGIIVLILTFGLSYIVAWMATSGFFSVVELVSGTKWQLGNGWFLIISVIFIVLLFVQYVRMDPLSWGRYHPEKFEMDPRIQSDIEQLTPSYEYLKHSGMAAKVIADVLVTGPRLFLGSFRCLRELSQMNSIEVNQCSQALAFIYGRGGSVSYEEFCQAGCGEQLKELKNIDGVHFVENAIFLSDELKTELGQLQ